MKPETCHNCLALTGGKGFPFVCRCGVSILHLREGEFTSDRAPVQVGPCPEYDCPHPLTAGELAEAMGVKPQPEGISE